MENPKNHKRKTVIITCILFIALFLALPQLIMRDFMYTKEYTFDAYIASFSVKMDGLFPTAEMWMASNIQRENPNIICEPLYIKKRIGLIEYVKLLSLVYGELNLPSWQTVYRESGKPGDDTWAVRLEYGFGPFVTQGYGDYPDGLQKIETYFEGLFTRELIEESHDDFSKIRHAVE